ncbi:hypothetical protein LTR46_000046 [Exophiala xenobiotica]|nr:hypothetical protein LTR46_000046 [Exophiala xenobiotica]
MEENVKMSSSASDPMYAIQQIPGKGKGLVATRKIPMGTRILSEKPIIRFPEAAPDSQKLEASIRRQVDVLTPAQRQSFLSMHNLYADDGGSQELGIIRTNALPFGDNELEGAIFLDACRINHACDNNAQKSWNENIKRHTIHALRDIEKDEEITIYYIAVVNNREARQEAFRRKFAFTCSCRLCSLPPDQSQESDRRLDEILKLDGLIGRDGLMGILSTPLRILRYVDQQICLYNKQGPNDVGLPRAYLDAAQIAIANGDLARARIFTERAATGWTILEGGDSSKVLQTRALSHDPSKHHFYGMSTKWKTAVDDIPGSLDSTQLEDWLWRREKPKQPGQPADLRNRTTFPAFTDLPSERDVDAEFYSSAITGNARSTGHGQPRWHWLFLAEIVDFATLVRLQMDVKDVDGATVPLFFYTDGRGSELAPSQVRKGYTIAILYAQHHAFMFSEPGIRHEEPTKLKSTGWNKNGHKADCKLLKDADLKGLFSLDWDNFERRVEFPLVTGTV